MKILSIPNSGKLSTSSFVILASKKYKKKIWLYVKVLNNKYKSNIYIYIYIYIYKGSYGEYT